MGFSLDLIQHSRSISVPVSVKILSVISDVLSHLDKDLDADSVLSESDIENPNEHYLCLFQVICIAALSMHEGVLIPGIKNIAYTYPSIQIYWSTGSKDEFNFGENSPQFLRFYKYFQKKIWNRVIHTSFSLSVFYELIMTLTRYSQQLSLCNNSIELILLKNIDDIDVKDQFLNLDIYFLLITALPANELNAFFIFLHQFLPEDLYVKQSDGHRVNVSSLFQTPSSDVQFLIKKADIYLKLFTTPDMPILQRITRSKTQDYLIKLLRNKKTLDLVKDQLISIREQQILTRLRLYLHLSSLLSRLLNQ